MENPNNLKIEQSKNFLNWSWNTNDFEYPKKDNETFELIIAKENETKKIQQLYQKNPLPNMAIKSIYRLYNNEISNSFKFQLKILQKTKIISSNKKQESLYQQLLELTESYQDSNHPEVRILPVWHAPKNEDLKNIYEIGFADLPVSDKKYEEGLYFFPSPEKISINSDYLIFSWLAFRSVEFVHESEYSVTQSAVKILYNYVDTFNSVFVTQPLQLLPRYQIELETEINQILRSIENFSDEEAFGIGFEFYMKSEYTKSLPYFLKAAEHKYPNAYLYLFRIYEDFIQPKNVEESKKWWTKTEENIHWFQEQAKTNNPSALHNLGIILNTQKNFAKACEYFTKAAALGYARAQNNLGICYYNGEGVEKNFSKAAELYALAANQDDAQAQCNLGFCYYNGDGVEKNLQKALFWYQKAVGQAHEIAKQQVKNYSNNILN